jgi:hypothetical protein
MFEAEATTPPTEAGATIDGVEGASALEVGLERRHHQDAHCFPAWSVGYRTLILWREAAGTPILGPCHHVPVA